MELAIKITFLLLPDVVLVGFIYLGGGERGRDLGVDGWVNGWVVEDCLNDSEEA